MAAKADIPDLEAMRAVRNAQRLARQARDRQAAADAKQAAAAARQAAIEETRRRAELRLAERMNHEDEL
jgi:hypothetical protein